MVSEIVTRYSNQGILGIPRAFQVSKEIVSKFFETYEEKLESVLKRLKHIN